MANSRNWKALAIPSLDGKKTELNVSGEVQSGFNPPKLKKRQTKENRPPNVFALDLLNIAGGPFAEVTYKEDITGQKHDIVLVYDEKNGIEAAIRIEAVNSLQAGSEIDKETGEFFSKIYQKENKISIAELLDDPSSFAKKRNIEISDNVIKRIDNLKKESGNKKYLADDPVNTEIIDFYNKTVINGKYIEDWATDPEKVAEKLNYKVSKQAIERIKEIDINRFIGHRGGQVGIVWIVVGIVVTVIVLVDLTALNKDRVIIDKSGILKF